MKQTFLVCCDTGCLMNGSEAVAEALEKEIKTRGLAFPVELSVKKTGCHGQCQQGPLVKLVPDGVAYYRVKPSDAPEIVAAAENGAVVERLLYRDSEGVVHTAREDNPFYAPQVKLALRNVGEIDPESLAAYRERGGYEALKKALDMTPEEIIGEMEASGLRGARRRGLPDRAQVAHRAARMRIFQNMSFATGMRATPARLWTARSWKAIPHSVLEGMAICAAAIGAEEGFLYIARRVRHGRTRRPACHPPGGRGRFPRRDYP
jgi:NADH-quinone oxidoreductase subunit F